MGAHTCHYYLRLSVTDGCAFRCPYCQPDGPAGGARRREQLTAEEIRRVVSALAHLGVTRVRFTGGEPLSRPDLCEIVEAVRRIDGIHDIALTTNGRALAAAAGRLAEAGLSRVNVHLDSLKPDRYRTLTGKDALADVLAGIEAAGRAGLEPIKVNVVLMRGINDDELADFCEFAVARRVSVRFIELMNTGPSPEFVKTRFLSAEEARKTLSANYDLVPRFEERGASPAREYLLDGGAAVVGFIASESEPFCDACNRLRLTADGRFRVCLYEPDGFDLRRLIREGRAGDGEILTALARLLPFKRSHHPAFGEAGEQAFSMAGIGG